MLYRHFLKKRVNQIEYMLEKVKAKISMRKILSLSGLVFLIMLSQSKIVHAQTITQGYASDQQIQRATIVSLKQDDPKRVEPASLNNLERLHGLVVSANDAPFTLSTEEERTFVATTGRFEAFVSNENGVIQPGDYITVSRVAGIGMKAGDKEPYIIGRAVGIFDGETAVLSTTTVSDGGVDKKVAIGRIQIDIGVSGNPLVKPTKANLPGFLERLAESIAEKPVNPTRIYIGLVIFIGTVMLSGILLYSGIRSGIISVGRNPLSKKSITKSLMQVILTSVIILLLGVFAVYLLLRL